MLGNDVNLRDVEGRSALLLGKAKDNNASCAIGPMFRLFGKGFVQERSAPASRCACRIAVPEKPTITASQPARRMARIAAVRFSTGGPERPAVPPVDYLQKAEAPSGLHYWVGAPIRRQLAGNSVLR